MSARFQVQRTDLTVPALRIWAPQVNLTVNRTARAEWAPLDAGASERVVFFDGSDGAVSWAAEGRPPLAVDARVLEDGRGTAAIESGATAEGDGTTFRVTHRSALVPYTGTAGPPPSRNVSCVPAPCMLTDGDLGPPGAGPATTGPATTGPEATVDLGRSGAVTFIVVRGCPAECNVETSVDNVQWKVVGSGSKAFFSVTPILGQPIRSVRIRSTSDLSRVAEVSVW